MRSVHLEWKTKMTVHLNSISLALNQMTVNLNPSAILIQLGKICMFWIHHLTWIWFWFHGWKEGIKALMIPINIMISHTINMPKIFHHSKGIFKNCFILYTYKVNLCYNHKRSMFACFCFFDIQSGCKNVCAPPTILNSSKKRRWSLEKVAKANQDNQGGVLAYPPVSRDPMKYSAELPRGIYSRSWTLQFQKNPKTMDLQLPFPPAQMVRCDKQDKRTVI